MTNEVLPSITRAGSGARVDLWNNDAVLTFSVYGEAQKWIEVGNQGAGSIPYSIRAVEGADWITLSDSEG